MIVNLPVWGYYPPDDKPFIDPLYAPYIKKPMLTKDGEVCPVNTWAKQGYDDGFVNPDLVRRGWGLSFQLLHPDKDPCPEGWTKGVDGWCVENQPEFGDHGLYSSDAFVPKYQYWNSYAPRLLHPSDRQLNQFDQRSINPTTGNYVNYSVSYPSEMRSKYGSLVSKDSYLA